MCVICQCSQAEDADVADHGVNPDLSCVACARHTAPERDAIIKGGPREKLDHNCVFGTDDELTNAQAAYDAIKTILSRIGADSGLRITGIDSRSMPPKRESVDAEVVLTGRLMWEGTSGVQCKLQLEWASPTIYIINLRIEPVEQPSAAPLSMSPSARLSPGERIDDGARLHQMQEHIDNGLTPKAAARAAARAMPDPPTNEDSLTSRLARKFRQRRTG
jgi:hypothetical protein